MSDETFFKNSSLPFAECRFSTDSKRGYKTHLHKTFSIGAIDSGKVEYQVAGQRSLLESGSLALINPEVPHSCNSLGEQKRSYFVLYLDVAWCAQVQQAIWKVDKFVPVEKVRIDDNELYQQYCTTMRLLMDKETHLMETEQLLAELATTVFKKSCNPQVAREEPIDDKVELLKIKLGSSLKEDLTLRSLAARLQINPYTLLRRFKKATGVTPHVYRMNCRIEQAKHLLQNGVDISETAIECGFFDQSHLHRHFKAITTVTPREYQVNFIQ